MALWAEAASGTGSELTGTIWTDREIKALIALLGEGNVQDELDRAVRNKVVYEKVAQNCMSMGITEIGSNVEINSLAYANFGSTCAL